MGALLLAVVLVAAIAATGIRQLYHASDTWNDAEFRLSRIDALSLQLQNLEQQASGGEDVAAGVTAIAGPMTAGIADLSRLAPGRMIERVDTTWRTYLSALEELQQLQSDGQTSAAQAWTESRTKPAGNVFRITVQNGLIEYRTAASTVKRTADAGMVGLIALAAAAMCLLIWLNDRQRRTTVQTLIAQEERFRALVQHGADLISVLDRDGVVQYQSPSIERVLRRPVAETVGQPFARLLHPADPSKLERLIEQAVHRNGEPAVAEFRLGHANGAWITVESKGIDLMDDPAVRGIVLTSRDVSERKHLAEQLSHLAFHDPLTDLPNRALFMDRLTHGIGRANRSGEPLTVLFLDLDGFKQVNDTLGHERGDDLLIQVAQRLRASIRPGDTAARLGGDEFTVLLENADAQGAIVVAERIITRIAAPIEVGGQEVQVRTSVGMTTRTDPFDRAEELVRRADLAMYAAKEEGKNRWVLFDPTVHTRSESKAAAVTG